MKTDRLLISMFFTLLFASPIAQVFAGTGTIHVSGNVPSITSIEITPTGGSGNLSAIDVYTWCDIKVVAYDPDRLTDIQKLEVRVAEDIDSWMETRDFEVRYGFRWFYDSTWQGLGASGWTAPDAEYFSVAGSSKPSDMTATEGAWTFKVRLAYVAHYTDSDVWTIEAHVWDKSGNEAWRSNNFDVNLYLELSVPSSISFSASPSEANKTGNNMPFVLRYRANAIAKLQTEATDPTSSLGDSFDANTLLIDDDENPDTDARCQKFSNTPADWWTGLSVAGTPDPQALNSWWWVSVPEGTPTGTYTFTYTITITITGFAGWTMSFVNPVEGATVSGVVPIETVLLDSYGNPMTSAEYRIDSDSWQSMTLEGTYWTTNWNTDPVSEGQHTITVKGICPQGTGEISITVSKTSQGYSPPEGFALGKVEVAAENSLLIQPPPPGSNEYLRRGKSIGSIFVGTSKLRRLCYWVNMHGELRIEKPESGYYGGAQVWLAIHTSDHPAGEICDDVYSLFDLKTYYAIQTSETDYVWKDDDYWEWLQIGADTPVYLVVWLIGDTADWGEYGGYSPYTVYCRNVKAHIQVVSYDPKETNTFFDLSRDNIIRAIGAAITATSIGALLAIVYRRRRNIHKTTARAIRSYLLGSLNTLKTSFLRRNIS